VDLHAAAHVFVEDLEEPGLDPDDAHHLARVLRLRAGEAVTVYDGRGAWRPCRWTGTGVEAAGEVLRVPDPEPPLVVAFAVPKGDRPEWVVQKLTETGVDRIVLLRTEHTVVRWEGERAARHLSRLRRVAREAAMQSRRLWLPVVEGVVPLADLEASVAGPVALAHPGGQPVSLGRPVVAVGPEGGWSAQELSDHELVDLGPTILRAETASLSVGILMSALRAGIVAARSRFDGA